jgi:hypothetical protein
MLDSFCSVTFVALPSLGPYNSLSACIKHLHIVTLQKNADKTLFHPFPFLYFA